MSGRRSWPGRQFCSLGRLPCGCWIELKRDCGLLVTGCGLEEPLEERTLSGQQHATCNPPATTCIPTDFSCNLCGGWFIVIVSFTSGTDHITEPGGFGTLENLSIVSPA